MHLPNSPNSPSSPPLATAHTYQRRTPEASLLRRVVMAQWPGLERDVREANDGRGLPRFIAKAVDGFIKCGVLGHGFLRLFCRTCKTDQLVAFSCKVRGLCSSCDGRRMTELAAHIVDSVIPDVPVRQFVLTLPADLRAVVAWNAELRGKVLCAFMRAHFARLGRPVNPKNRSDFRTLNAPVPPSASFRFWPRAGGPAPLRRCFRRGWWRETVGHWWWCRRQLALGLLLSAQYVLQG